MYQQYCFPSFLMREPFWCIACGALGGWVVYFLKWSASIKERLFKTKSCNQEVLIEVLWGRSGGILLPAILTNNILSHTITLLLPRNDGNKCFNICFLPRKYLFVLSVASIMEAFCVFYYIHHFHIKSGEHG